MRREPLGPGISINNSSQVGSLAGAAHLLHDNAGVLRAAQREQKSRVEHKGKSCFDFGDFQYEYKPWKRGLAIPNVFPRWQSSDCP